jgi:hypothetical protein
VGPGASSRSVNTTGDRNSCNDSDGEVGSCSSKKTMGNKGAKGTSRSPMKNTKLLEFSEDIDEVMKRNEAGSGKVQPRAVTDVTERDGFLAPVVRGVCDG